jgi:hypothetical protein
MTCPCETLYQSRKGKRQAHDVEHIFFWRRERKKRLRARKHFELSSREGETRRHWLPPFGFWIKRRGARSDEGQKENQEEGRVFVPHLAHQDSKSKTAQSMSTPQSHLRRALPKDYMFLECSIETIAIFISDCLNAPKNATSLSNTMSTLPTT